MKVCIVCEKPIVVVMIKFGDGLTCSDCHREIALSEEFYLSAVKELNEKGYFVDSYIADSAEDLSGVSAILFDECVDSLPSLPSGYVVKVVGEQGEQAIQIEYQFVEDESPLSVLGKAIDTFTWAVGLPAVGTDEYFNTLKTCYINNMGCDPD